MRLGLIYIILACAGCTFTQPSSENSSAVATDNDLLQKGFTLNSVAYGHFNEGSYTAALDDYKLLLSVNYELKIDTLIAQTLNDLGMVYYYLSTFDSSIYYYRKALTFYEDIGNRQQQAIVKHNLAIVYKDRGAYEKALELALEAAPELNGPGAEEAKGSCFNTIALLYGRLNEFESALEFHRKSLSVQKKIDDKTGIAQSYNNVANLYKKTKGLDSAQYYYEKSLALKREIGDRYSQASTLNNLGEVMFARNNLPAAEKYYRESLAIKREQSNKAGEVFTLNNLAQLAMANKQFQAAEKYLDESYAISNDLGLLDEVRTNYELRLQLAKRTHNTEQALLYAENLMIIKDSLLTKEKAEVFANLKSSYDLVTKEQQISLLEQDSALQQANLETKSAWIRGLVIAAILFSIVLVLIFRMFYLEQRNKRRVEVLLQELHHRVKNNLQILSSILGLQSQQLTDQNALQAVKSSEGRINAMALIHRKLYATEQNRTINLKDYTTDLTTYLVHAYGYYGKEFKLNLSLQEIQLDVDKAIAIGLIMNELVSNAFKYAYIDHPDPALSIEINKTGGKELEVIISDNGNGYLPKKDAKNTSFGLKMVNMLMEELNGKYEVDVVGGTRYHLQIPVG